MRTLKDHSDAVYGLAFNPDGRLLASAAADRAVKVWDVASGTRLYTLSEATDWLYGVSWSPDGRHVAAGGVDKSIRVWQVSAKEGKLVHSVFAHEGAVTRLLYATDGKTLYSVGEDNTPKAWDTGTMRERRVYPRQPEAVLGLAAAPDHKQLAIGRYDGTLLLVDEATAKILSEPLPFKPKPPQLTKLSPAAGPRGQTVRITFDGKYLDGASEVVSPHSGLRAKIVAAGKSDHSVQAEIIFPANMPAGTVKLGIQTPAGQTTQLPFIVDLFPSVAEVEPNDSPATGQKITLPVTVVGTIGQAGSVDYYRFDAQSGQEIGVHVLTNSIGSKLDAVMELIDERGRVVARCTKDVLGYK